MKRKILLISSNSSSKGGGERYLVYLTKGFKSLNYDVTVLISSLSFMDNWNDMYLKEGAKVIRIGLTPLVKRKFRFLSSIFDFMQIKKVRDVCFQVKPDYIIVNQQYDEDGLDYITGALNYSKNKTISVMHMPMTFDKNLRPLGYIRGLILKKWYKKSNHKIVFVSDGSKNEFNNYYRLNGQYFVVNNGIPKISCIKETAVRKIINNSFPTLSFIGQINIQKNLSLLVQSWIHLNKTGLICNLLLIGDGPCKIEVKNQIYESGFDDRVFLIDWSDTPEDYYGCIDIFVMTSLFEGLPLALIEVAGSGIPCVITPFNGSVDVARHAPWVKVSNSYSVEEICDLIRDSIFVKNINTKDVDLFNNYFSIERVCNELIKIF